MIRIDISDEQSAVQVDEARLRKAVDLVLADAGINQGSVSLALVDDPTIHELNNRFLSHDEPTDVLSFALEQRPGYLEGEIIVSGDTAVSSGSRFGWLAGDELLLYVIHGTLHLVGYDDLDPVSQAEMRLKEREYLGRFGLTPRYAEEGAEG
jgi:probable rRNA maturation factor